MFFLLALKTLKSGSIYIESHVPLFVKSCKASNIYALSEIAHFYVKPMAEIATASQVFDSNPDVAYSEADVTKDLFRFKSVILLTKTRSFLPSSTWRSPLRPEGTQSWLANAQDPPVYSSLISSESMDQGNTSWCIAQACLWETPAVQYSRVYLLGLSRYAWYELSFGHEIWRPYGIL